MPVRTVEEKQLNVHNFFLIKHIVDDREAKDELNLIGTMVQHVFRGKDAMEEDVFTSKNYHDAVGRIAEDTQSHSFGFGLAAGGSNHSTDLNSLDTLDHADAKEETPIMFKYRFNDAKADKQNLDLRRTEIHETRDLGKDYRHTLQVKAPLELDVVFDAFPFKVKTATLMIELSTFTSSDCKTRLRPNIIVHRKEKRIMFGIQKDPNASSSKKSKKIHPAVAVYQSLSGRETALFEQAKEKIDKSYVYDFVSPFPNITYLFDNSAKKYCPKYSIQFLLVEDGMKKFFEIVFPMLLIAAMNHLNVVNAVKAIRNGNEMEVEAVDYLNNSATLALSVVVFLPTMIGTSRFHSIFQVNNLYISTIFVALALSSLPYAVVETTIPAQVGTYLFWASFLFPVVNGFRFWRFVRAHEAPCSHHFMDDARGRTYPQQKFKPSPDSDVMSDFISIEELVNKNPATIASMDFRLAEDRGKFKVLEIDTASLDL
ncbi:unnamed protein product [Cylindrotheca closterium]|uniref:Uncharacterized protein n=1 Tax=Cylindrotheca closterium TaxID=2856 RepID=A0AAD2PTX1_9STRA|nr:unnamed protein product [Cylindrotheca closterium]